MSLLYTYLIFINIVLMLIILNKHLKSEDILKSLSISIMTFLLQYTFLAIILLSLDKFGVGKIIIGVSIINIILAIYTVIKEKNYILDNINIKITTSIILIIILLLPFVWQKSQVVFPNSDAGVYALKAIDLLHGDTKSVKELVEYGIVEDREKLKVIDFQKKQIGLYEKGTIDEKYFYDYHGLPTWPSIMALSGKICGEQNIVGILTILFCLMLIFLYYILDELKVNKGSKVLAIIILGFSPLTIFLAKYPLSEMFWTTMFMFSILAIINKSTYIKIIGAIALGLLGFIHVSTFMYFPMFALILFMLQIIYRRKIYGIVNIIFNILFIISLGYGCIVSKYYFLAQYSDSMGLYLGITNEIMALVTIGILSMIVIIVTILTTCNERFSKFMIKVWDKVDIYILKIFKYVLFILLICLIYQAYRLGFTDKYVKGAGSWAARTSYANKGISSLLHLNIISIMEATSYIILPTIIYKIFKMKQITNKVKIFIIIFIYSFIIYTVIRIDTPNNYYASRYFFTVLIPSIIILFSLIRVSDNWKKVILITTIIINLPFNIVQYNEQEFKNNFQMIEDAMNVIEPDSIVLIDSNAYPELYMTNLRERNNNLVYPIDIKLDQSVIKDKQIYVISNEDRYENELTQKLMKNYEISDAISTTSGTYPLSLKKSNIKINIYKSNKEQTIYMPNDGTYEGFNNLENDEEGEYFRWTDDDSKVNMMFSGTRGKIRIYCGNIPFDKIKREKINLNIRIDNYLLYSSELNKDNASNGYIELEIPEGKIKDIFKHVLDIKCDTWSPSEFGSEDTRQLGILIKKIEVIK